MSKRKATHQTMRFIPGGFQIEEDVLKEKMDQREEMRVVLRTDLSQQRRQALAEEFRTMLTAMK